MTGRRALARSGFASAACVACCAPRIVAALGVTAGLTATVGIFVGLAAAIAVVLAGGAWIAAPVGRTRSNADDDAPTSDAVPVAAPVRRHHP